MGLKDLELFAQQESELAGQSQAVNQSLTVGLDKNPDEYAKLLKLSAKTGIAPDLAKDFRPELEKRQKLEALSVDDLVRSNPKTAKFLANPDNAAVAQDDVQSLSTLEQILLKPVDYTRSALEGVVGKGAGSTLSGAGELYGVASRSLEALLDKVLPNSVMSTLRTPVPWFLDPEQVLKRPGQTLKQAGEYVAPPKERQGLDTDVASGIGQIGFQIASYLTTGGTLSAASMYSQGADVMATKTAKDEADPAMRDTAIVAGGAITAITEKYGLDKILNRVPPEIKNRALRFIADKVAAGGIEAGQEIAEGLLHDLTRKVLTDENAPILEGALKEGTAAALSAAIVRAALGVRGYRQAKQQEEVIVALSGDSKLRERLPEKYQEFVASVTENGPVQNAYIPIEQFQTFFQSQGIDPEQIADEIGATNYREALAVGSDVVIPIDKFAANVAPTDYLQGLIPDLKFDQGAQTPRERQAWMAEMDARESELEASMQALVDEQTRQGGINQAIQEIVTDIEGQLRGAGYDAQTAQSSATVMRGMAILAERDLRGRAAAEGREVTDAEIVDAARKLWSNYGLTVSRPMPGVLTTSPTSDITIDPLLDALRAGSFPTDQQIFGRSLAEFVRDSGGLVPSGEILTADENMERRPFQKKLTQKDGMSLDKALEAAVQAGYFPGMTAGELTEADFLNALDDDLRGSGVFSINVTDNNALAMREAMNSLSEYLDSLNIDLAALDNRQVRALIEQARNTPELQGVIGQFDQLVQRALAGEIRTLPEQIEVDGVMRPTTNSEGRQIHPTQEGVVNFWRWFGDSKVVDDQGRPLVVYHGTKGDFDTFDISRIGSGMGNTGFLGAGFYFTSNDFMASGYSGGRSRIGEGSNVMPVYLSLQNPLNITGETYENDSLPASVIAAINAAMPAEAGLDAFDRSTSAYAFQSAFSLAVEANPEVARKFTENIKAAGYDGVIYDGGYEIVAFDPNQIKSATGNSGDFSADTGNILFQFAGQRAKTADMYSLVEAQDQIKQGRSPEAVRRRTGWFLGVDGMWRFEIADDEAKFVSGVVKPEDIADDVRENATLGMDDDSAVPDSIKKRSDYRQLRTATYKEGTSEQLKAFGHTDEDALKNLAVHLAKRRSTGAFDITKVKDGEEHFLSDVLDHPKLYAAYPDLADLLVTFTADTTQYRGMYSPRGDRISMAMTGNSEQMLSTLLHEIQHAIQEREGFAKGGNTDSEFTGRVRNALDRMESEARQALDYWKGLNKEKLDDAEKASEVARFGLMYESAQRLIDYANRDKPSGVFRLIRNEMQWIYAEDFRENDEARELQRDFYGIPRSGNKRNQYIGDMSFRAAQVLLEKIPADLRDQFKNDPRTMKGMINALRRESDKKRKELAPMRDLEGTVRRAADVRKAHRYSTPFQIYEALAGEIEARNTQARQQMTDAERQATPPSQTADVPAERTVVMFGGLDIRAPMASALDDGGQMQTLFQGEQIDEATGLPLNPDGTVTVYHHTSAEKAEQIAATGQLKSAGEPDVYVTTRRETDTGYGDTAVAIRVDPALLQIDDEFPNGRVDYRMSIGRPGGSMDVQVGEYPQQLNQGNELDDKRGLIQFGQNRKFNIVLLEKANLSTFLHEAGHFYLEVLGDLATAEGAPEQIKNDYAKVLAFLGLESRDQLTLDGKTKGSAEYNRAVEAHEKFARANETYLMEGNAPTPELQDIFQRFKSWMTLLYKQITSLNVKLNNEVREVFDRIYATEVEIQAAKDQVNVEALFLDAAAAGMSAQEFELYRASVAQATESGKEALTAKLMRQLMRERKEWWKESRDKMREEVTLEVDGQPVYQAFKALVAGKMDDDTEIKLNKQSLVDKYGADYVKRLPRGFARIYSATGGMDADTAAEFLGYNSGDALIEALVGMRDRKELIEAETDQRMRDTYGDLMTDGTIADEAKIALHNGQRENVLMAELRALRRKQREVAPFVQAERDKARQDRRNARAATEVPPAESFRRAARGIVGQTAVRDLDANKYLLASRKAARQAFEAMSKGDYMLAADAKQKELLNHHLYLESRKAKEEADKILKYAQKFEKGSTREQMGKAGANYLEQIDAILDRYEFRRVALSKIDRRASLADWIAEQEAQGLEPSISAVLLNESRLVNYRQVPLDELRAIYDAVRNIEHLARLKNKLKTKQAEIEFNDAIGELVASAEVAGTRTPLPLDMSAMTMRERAGDTVSRLDAMLLKMEQVVEWLDGGNVNGPWHTYIWNPIAEAQTREYDLTRKLTERLAKSLEDMPKERRLSMLDTFEIPGMGKVTRKYLISIALNMGNQGNIDKMMRGMGWDIATIERGLAKLDDADWSFVQETWDTINSVWPEIAELEKRMTGLEPPKVEAQPYQVRDEQGNVTRTLAGGYYPLVYDPRLSEQGAKQEAGNLGQLFEEGYVRATTPKGHTQARTEGFAAPMLLDFEQVISQHMAKVVKDLTHREAVVQANKILTNREIRNVLQETMGPAYEKQMLPWLRSVVNDRNGGSAQGLSDFSRWMMTARANVVAATMGFKATTMIAQITGISQSLDKVKGRYLSQAVLEYLRHPIALTNQVRELSGEMRNRSNTLDRDIRDQLRNLTGQTSGYAQVQRFAFHGIAIMDTMVTVPTWMGAYRQALDEGASEETALLEADAAVRMTQGAGGAKDLAAIQRNNELAKSVTMFYSYFSVLYNRMRDMGRDVQEIRDMPRFLSRVFFTVMVPAVLGELILGRGPDDDEDPAAWTIRKVLLYPMMAIPVLRDVVSSIDSGYDYRFSPLANVFDKVGKAATATGKAIEGDMEWGEYSVKVGETMGYVFGVAGTAQMAATGKYLWRVSEGEENPDNIAELLAYALLGKRKED